MEGKQERQGKEFGIYHGVPLLIIRPNNSRLGMCRRKICTDYSLKHPSIVCRVSRLLCPSPVYCFEREIRLFSLCAKGQQSPWKISFFRTDDKCVRGIPLSWEFLWNSHFSFSPLSIDRSWQHLGLKALQLDSPLRVMFFLERSFKKEKKRRLFFHLE